MSAPPAKVEWALLAVTAAAAAFALLGPPLSGGTSGPEVGHLLEVSRPEHGPAEARFDDAAFRAASEVAGLPEPPELDGADPVPVRNILEQHHRWTRAGDPEAIGNLGRIYLALEEHRAALECFAAATALEPEHPHWRYLLGVEAQSLGLDDLAIEVLEQSAARDPGYATTFARLGRLYLERDDLDAAERNFDRCRAIDPNQSLGYVGLGRVALARGDYDKAAAALLQAVQATPNDHRAYRFLSQALAPLGREEDSRRAAEIAERLPKYAGWLVFDDRLQAAHALANTQRYIENQMRLAQSSGDAAQLAGLAGELLRRRPDDYKAWGVLADSLIRLERVDEAREAIDRALAIEPESVSMLCIRAQVEMLAGNLASALEVLDAALAIDPGYASSHDIRGRVLYLTGRHDEAFASMQRAIALDPKAIKMRLALAVMHEQRGAVDDAKRELRALLEIEPGHAGARERLRRLGG